ncbi:5-p-4-tetraphosphate phosphorylase [Grosmannia clavigera kw1407]|uniref:5-p-4-tetraphosphate phosphorylase n=1 Tax=Grosmannia clavigera (strain kw1407 / UAMH 11150) TaxID=655863 RepID=F0XJ75_GROCL|nr:5-p-4-tetraphosphate phosphorylase [Grosmannia clavigera kw1407]EFX02077.1 5-p-4-tetraphosphate phosphorylase [Grosmannia clavigera kw1407]
MADKIDLPDDLHAAATARFDKLREQGLLFYFPSAGELVQHKDFTFDFRISPSIARKPVLAADAPERRGRGGPFVDPDPRFVVAQPGADHVLELSIHAMVRPHYVLHTKHFKPQSDDLGLIDMAASWAVMQRVAAAGHRPMMIYNCGYEGGASQGHKHVQVFAEPDPGFVLFPETVSASASDTAVAPHVRFLHFIARLDEDSVDPPRLQQTYERLMISVRSAHSAHRARHPEEALEADCSAAAYNVILTPRWMCLIPRRRGGQDGTGAGALGMLGVVWLRDARERAHWTDLGLTDHLVWMGLPQEQ